MIDMKKRTVMLNISLGLCAFYEVCFFIGYLLQKPLFGRDFYDYDELEPVFSPVVIILMLFLAAGVVIFNIMLRKHQTKAMTIGTAVFAAAAFESNLAVKAAASLLMSVYSARLGGTDALTAATLSSHAVSVMDLIFSVFFVASLVLMICASREKE